MLFEKHSDYLSEDIVSFNQVRGLVMRLLIDLQEKYAAYEEEEEQEMSYGNEQPDV
jgi:hypothetical protein